MFKTAVAALCQQHFGAELNASHLPASFASTAQAIQCLASQAKDALLVVDDFVPTGRHSDSALQNAAEQMFRSAGNPWVPQGTRIGWIMGSELFLEPTANRFHEGKVSAPAC